MKTEEALYVKNTGYSTGGNFSLEEWFKAREIVRRRPSEVSRIEKKIRNGTGISDGFRK